MTVTVDVPEALVAAIQARGESVANYLVQAADQALEKSRSTVEERKGIVEQMMKDREGRRLGQSIRSAIEEGRRY